MKIAIIGAHVGSSPRSHRAAPRFKRRSLRQVSGKPAPETHPPVRSGPSRSSRRSSKLANFAEYWLRSSVVRYMELLPSCRSWRAPNSRRAALQTRCTKSRRLLPLGFSAMPRRPPMRSASCSFSARTATVQSLSAVRREVAGGYCERAPAGPCPHPARQDLGLRMVRRC